MADRRFLAVSIAIQDRFENEVNLSKLPLQDDGCLLAFAEIERGELFDVLHYPLNFREDFRTTLLW